MFMLEKTVRLNRLFDVYQPLLTAKQREYMTLYYLEDFSLAEIAHQANVTRQAVYDNLKRTEQSLENYEEKLKVYRNFQQRIKLLKKLEHLIANDARKDEQLNVIYQIKDLS